MKSYDQHDAGTWHAEPAEVVLAASCGPNVTLADRKNMAFSGSMVARGCGKGVVVATGSATHTGQPALDGLGNVESLQ